MSHPAWPSPNWDERPGDGCVDMLVLHYTGMPSAAAARARLCDPAARVSAHYLIDEDGRIEPLVGERKRAWHAGISHWAGRSGLNDVSIGIELVNPGHDGGYRPFPEAQIDACLTLCHGILARWPIPKHRVVAHSDIAPNRKIDPGELFPFAHLAAEGVGLWPEAAAIPDGFQPVVALRQLGYATDVYALADIVAAFQRHWCPEALGRGLCPSTLAALAGLVVQLER